MDNYVYACGRPGYTPGRGKIVPHNVITFLVVKNCST